MEKSKNGLLKIGVLSAFMMLVIMLPSMIQNHGIFIIRGDYVDQYIPRLIRSREILMTGGATWDWFNFLGASFNKVNILFSTNAICLLFPSQWIPYAVTYMHLIRIAMIAMAAYAYLRYMVKKEKNAFLGAILYTFSAYTFVNFEFMQFLEALWVFPLLLLAVEKMFRDENYPYQLILMAFLSCCISFYFFVFSTIWFGIYFLCRFFLSDEWHEKRNVKQFLLAVVEYSIGFLCAFLVFAPFLYSLFHSSGSAVDIGDTKREFYEYFVDIGVISRIFTFFVPAASNRFSTFGSSAWVSRGLFLPVFGSVFLVLFLQKKESPKWMKFLIYTSILCVSLPAFCLLFNMFSETYTRHAYGAVLFFVLATIWCMDCYEEKELKKSLWFILRFLIGLFCVYYVLSFIAGDDSKLYYLFHGRIGEGNVERKFRIFVLISTAIMYLALIGYVYHKKIHDSIIPITVVVILLYGCGYTVMNLESEYLLDYQDTSMSLSEQVDRYFFTVPEMEEGNDYRIDASNQLRNYTYVAKKPSVSIFESVRSNYADELCEYLNYYTGQVFVVPQDADNETRTLLGAKYYYDLFPKDNIPVPKDFSYVKSEKGVDVYRNENYIGIGFSYDSYITRTEFEKFAKKDKSNADLMLQTLVVEDADVSVVKDLLKPYEKGDKTKERVSFDTFNMTSDGFSAKVSLDEPKVMYVAAPYEDEGWQATCNGKELNFIKANIGLIAFPLEAGENEVVFRYQLPSNQVGRYVTCAGWIALLIYIMIQERKRVNKKEM